MQGTIDFRKYLGGCLVRQDPVGELFTVNPDRQVPERLGKNKKTVTIEGHLTIGADHLTIETQSTAEARRPPCGDG